MTVDGDGGQGLLDRTWQWWTRIDRQGMEMVDED